MRFYHILLKNSISHLLKTSQDYFRTPPPRFRKEMDNIYVHFRRVFVEFVVLLTKIWPTNINVSKILIFYIKNLKNLKFFKTKSDENTLQNTPICII